MARKKQSRAWAPPLHIAIGTAPRPVPNLDEEIRLLKPALLYGDKVTLISPMAALIGGVLDVARLDTDALIKLIVDVAPVVAPDGADDLAAGVREYRRLKQKRGKPLDEILKVNRFGYGMRQMFQSEMLPVLQDMAMTSGADELAPAIEADLLEVSPLVTRGHYPDLRHLFEGHTDAFADDVVSSYLEQVTELVSKRGTYPLFDDQTGKLLAMGVHEGVFDIPPGADERGKQVHAAAAFMDRLPTFENASISEILHIRDELGEPLVRFRAAMIRIGDLIEAPPHEEEFRDQIDKLYGEQIAPSLLEIDDRIRDNDYLRRLVGNLGPELGVVAGGVLTAVVARTADLPQLIVGVSSDPVSQAIAYAGGVTSVTSLSGWALKQLSEQANESRDIERQDLFFLYRAEKLLG